MAKRDVIREAQNPVTRTMVKIRPPFSAPSLTARLEFEKRLHAYCAAAWALARADPAEVRLNDGAGLEMDWETPSDLWPAATVPLTLPGGDADA
jgi:hypothetical protein